MITRNFDILMASWLCDNPMCLFADRAALTDENWLNGNVGGVKLLDGGFLAVQSGYVRSILYGSDNYLNPNKSNSVLLVGSGTDEETYNDFSLNYITELTVYANRTKSFTVAENAIKGLVTKVFINNTESDITINEAGIVTPVWGYTPTVTSTTETQGYVLLYRKKYDTPIVVPANGGMVNITLDIDIPFWNKPGE